MTKALLDRILRLVIASFLILAIGTSLITEARAQEAKPAAPVAPVHRRRKAYGRLHRISTECLHLARPAADKRQHRHPALRDGRVQGIHGQPLGQPGYQSLLDDGCLLLQQLDGDGPDPLLQQGLRARYGRDRIHLLWSERPERGAADPLDSQELFISLAGNVLLTPTFTVYKEIDHYHQWYFLFGVSHTFELTKMIGLKLAGSLSYLLSDDASTYPKYDDNALPTTDKYSNFHDGVISATLPHHAVQICHHCPDGVLGLPVGRRCQERDEGPQQERPAR